MGGFLLKKKFFPATATDPAQQRQQGAIDSTQAHYDPSANSNHYYPSIDAALKGIFAEAGTNFIHLIGDTNKTMGGYFPKVKIDDNSVELMNILPRVGGFYAFRIELRGYASDDESLYKEMDSTIRNIFTSSHQTYTVEEVKDPGYVRTPTEIPEIMYGYRNKKFAINFFRYWRDSKYSYRLVVIHYVPNIGKGVPPR